MPSVELLLRRLGKEGYRLTGPRRTILEEVVRRQAPFTSNELWAHVQQRYPTIGRATVFRTLDLLGQLGVVQRIHQDVEGGRCHAYVACSEQHHHHLICNGCGAVIDFEEDGSLERLVREIERRTSFQVEGHRLELIGLCPACQKHGPQNQSVLT